MTPAVTALPVTAPAVAAAAAVPTAVPAPAQKTLAMACPWQLLDSERFSATQLHRSCW